MKCDWTRRVGSRTNSRLGGVSQQGRFFIRISSEIEVSQVRYISTDIRTDRQGEIRTPLALRRLKQEDVTRIGEPELRTLNEGKT